MFHYLKKKTTLLTEDSERPFKSKTSLISIAGLRKLLENLNSSQVNSQNL